MTMFSTALGVFALLISAGAVAAVTKHLGTVGRTYPVVEPDLIAELRQNSLKTEKIREAMLAGMANNYQPIDLRFLPRATANRTFLVDMHFTLDRELSDANGQVIYPKGYSFNPLDYIVMAGGLIVIDGNDPDQVNWFLHSPYCQNRQVKLLLSGGKAADLIEQLQRPAFYLTSDMAERLRLAAAPSLIMRKGGAMQVQEFYVPPADRQGSTDEN
jgi:conjugal transfer pilus assembly protein TraW